MEIGAGDGSLMAEVLELLQDSRKRLRSLTIIDNMTTLFPPLLETVFSRIPRHTNVTLVEPILSGSFGPDTVAAEGSIDIANSSMMLHQIQNDSLVKLYLFRTYLALANQGRLFLSDLHPKYLQYLSEYYPEKYSQDGEEGIYKFDSGGSRHVYPKSIAALATWAESLGFRPPELTIPSYQSLLELKPRYQEMAKLGIPLFYVLSLAKDENRFVHYSEGTIKEFNQINNRLELTFSDDEVISIPWKGESPVKVGEICTIFSIKHPKEVNKLLIHVWSCPPNDSSQVRYKAVLVTPS